MKRLIFRLAITGAFLALSLFTELTLFLYAYLAVVTLWVAEYIVKATKRNRMAQKVG